MLVVADSEKDLRPSITILNTNVSYTISYFGGTIIGRQPALFTCMSELVMSAM